MRQFPFFKHLSRLCLTTWLVCKYTNYYRFYQINHPLNSKYYSFLLPDKNAAPFNSLQLPPPLNPLCKILCSSQTQMPAIGGEEVMVRGEHAHPAGIIRHKGYQVKETVGIEFPEAAVSLFTIPDLERSYSESCGSVFYLRISTKPA